MSPCFRNPDGGSGCVTASVHSSGSYIATAAAGGSFTATAGDGLNANGLAMPTAVDGSCIPEAVGARMHPGNFDYKSCNSSDCHIGFAGGWLYNNAAGNNWVAGATVTVTNSDGTSIRAVTASDGFFSLIGNSEAVGSITSPFNVCVSKCPNTSCATANHTSTDCQTSGCHGSDNQRIFLTQAIGGTSTDTTCTDLPSDGPRVHNQIYDSQSCRICHGDIYTGGFLYDGLTSNTTVGSATVTLTPIGGSPMTTTTGPGGMFYYPGIVSAPYDVCVSRCEYSICSAANTHTTPEDCRTCHDESMRIHLP